MAFQEQVLSMNELQKITADAVQLLKQLITIPSFSKEEDGTADLICDFFKYRNIHPQRYLNNVWVQNKYFDPSKPTILLNSHHDTVKPNAGYVLNPFEAIEKDGKLFGLGSNDAGGSLVSLIAAFLFFSDQGNLKYNLVFAATAEEEISGKNGIEALLKKKEFANALGISKAHLQRMGVCAIVGEPTQMQMAVAEKGLIVLDCIANGVAGHAASDEGENAIVKAMNDIQWFRSYRFEKISELLGPVKLTVTSIETENKTHNILPSQCKYIVDVRVNELYNLEEILETIKLNVQSEVTERSLRLRSTSISLDHPLVKAGLSLGRNYYGSPTTSDKALMNFPSLKIGPGDSARSHTADEFIYVDEIKKGIELYMKLLQKFLF